MVTQSTTESWAMIHAERARIADLLEGLSPSQWHAGSLCAAWTVEQVTAHLTAAASTGRWAWLRSIVRAGLDADQHNARQLARYLGATPQETLDRYRGSMALTVAPTGDHAAWLGEVVVHGQDIAAPLGADLVPDPLAVHAVADFYARKDFAVHSRRLVAGLTLEADDVAFRAGSGPVVRGAVLDLVMVMAGRAQYLTALRGDGLAELARRLA